MEDRWLIADGNDLSITVDGDDGIDEEWDSDLGNEYCGYDDDLGNDDDGYDYDDDVYRDGG